MPQKKPFWEMTTAELREATKQYDREELGLPGKPLTAADRKLHVRASLRARQRRRMAMTGKRRRPDRDPAVPPELAEVLRVHPGAQAAFDAMPPSHRAEYARWVGEAKKAETRIKRASEAVKRIQAWAKKHQTTSR